MVARETWTRAVEVVRPALLLAPSAFIADIQTHLTHAGVAAAVRERDQDVLFGWLLRTAQMQGISDRTALGYAERHGLPSRADIAAGLRGCRCDRLRSYWTFADCRYRKATATCARPTLIGGCLVPRLPARKGSLAQFAVSLHLFIRDVCGGDLVGWIDDRLASADTGLRDRDRGLAMADSVVLPLSEVQGVSRKVVSMAMADLLLGGDPGRERWVAAGASMVAVDSLVHAHLHRTGILRLLGAEHAYGPACVAPGGCEDVVRGLARRIDARAFSPGNPADFPRFVQFALWHFCAEGGWSICNGRRIDDRLGCRQAFCPAGRNCARLPLG